MSSHLLGEIERVCENLIVIEEGQLLRAGTIADLTDITSVLVVEVDEGAMQLAARLQEDGFEARAEGRQVEIVVEPADTERAQTLVIERVIELELSLLRLEQRRRQLEELFQGAPESTAR